MNLNELYNSLTNIQMKFGHIPKEEVKFSNAEIILLDDFTISDVKYDGENIIFRLETFSTPSTETCEVE